ncbi:hypothetical protein BDV93DRAFT_559804 [Ceratobasidium sp. AG-I]|nr:hypothetical protein BDV93DRAFT_559804 [Ceratobasidium sp. AG-I]
MIHSQRIFRVPELAALICSFTSISDRARLLRVSRTFFDVAIPSVWREVDGVEQLFRLLSTCVMTFNSSNALVEVQLNIHPRECVPFSRFDLYASHVKSLDIYGSRRDAFRVSGWSLLLDRARQEPLLPNLRTLIIKTPLKSARGKPHLPDQLMWIMSFSSPSMTILSTPPTEASKPPTISYRAASAVLKSMTQCHSNIQELSLFPDSLLGCHRDDGENSLLFFVSGKAFYQYLVGANQLRRLSGTMAWLKPEPLLVLGRLPLLESITIYSSFDTHDWSDEPEVSEDSFPSLQQLSMHEVDPYDLLQVLRTGNMFQHVTSLDLGFDVTQFLPEEPVELWMIETLFPVLSNVPHLCDFSLKIPALEDKEPLTVITPSVLGIFSALPLKSVTLGNMEWPFRSWPHNLGISWPLVTKLSLPDQALSLDLLHRFAVLPQLEYLELKLDVQWLENPSTPGPGPRAPLHTLVSTHDEPEDRDISSADEVVQYAFILLG